MDFSILKQQRLIKNYRNAILKLIQTILDAKYQEITCKMAWKGANAGEQKSHKMLFVAFVRKANRDAHEEGAYALLTRPFFSQKKNYV
jgi:hypothetical protein